MEKKEVFSTSLIYFVVVCLFVTIRILNGFNLFSFMGEAESYVLGGVLQVGILFLLCLSWASMTISFSPLLRVLGVKFFEVGLEDGKVVTLLIGDKLRPLHVSRVVVISDSCFYGVK